MKSVGFAVDQWSASADSDEVWIEAGIWCTVTERCIASLSNHQTRGWIEPSHCGENKSALTILNNFQSPALDDTPDPSVRAGQISRDMQTLAFPFLDVLDRS